VFTNLLGTFRCLRCAVEQDTRIQTYLFKTTFDNTSCDYRVGDAEAVDGLDEFDELHPWDGRSPLVLAVGDWDCRTCGLPWQWAKLTLSVEDAGAALMGRIEALESLVPETPRAFDGVHRVQPWLADLAGFNVEQRVAWADLSPAARCEAMAAGFNAWRIEVAGMAPLGD
jgi:hypothetical protein